MSISSWGWVVINGASRKASYLISVVHRHVGSIAFRSPNNLKSSNRKTICFLSNKLLLQKEWKTRKTGREVGWGNQKKIKGPAHATRATHSKWGTVRNAFVKHMGKSGRQHKRRLIIQKKPRTVVSRLCPKRESLWCAMRLGGGLGATGPGELHPVQCGVAKVR